MLHFFTQRKGRAAFAAARESMLQKMKTAAATAWQGARWIFAQKDLNKITNINTKLFVQHVASSVCKASDSFSPSLSRRVYERQFQCLFDFNK